MHSAIAALALLAATMLYLYVAAMLDPHNDPEFMRHHNPATCAYCNGGIYTGKE